MRYKATIARSSRTDGTGGCFGVVCCVLLCVVGTFVLLAVDFIFRLAFVPKLLLASSVLGFKKYFSLALFIQHHKRKKATRAHIILYTIEGLHRTNKTSYVRLTK